MPNRQQEVTPFNSGSSSAEKRDKPGKVRVDYLMSTKHNSGIMPDNLKTALGARLRTLPQDTPIYWKHSKESKPRGADYNPTMKGRKVTPTGRGQGVYSYGGAPNKKGDNPLGSHSNKKGDNPLGHAMNKVGINVLGKPSGKRGDNPLGNHSNRTGEKSGYKGFRPTGGGKNV